MICVHVDQGKNSRNVMETKIVLNFMAVIKKKILSQYFEEVVSGKKKFELRLGDFDIKEGDTLILEEWDKEQQLYTGRTIEKKVTHVFKFQVDKLFWLEEEIKKEGLQIISFDS